MEFRGFKSFLLNVLSWKTEAIIFLEKSHETYNVSKFFKLENILGGKSWIKFVDKDLKETKLGCLIFTVHITCESINRLSILVTFSELERSFKKRRYVRANLRLS